MGKKKDDDLSAAFGFGDTSDLEDENQDDVEPDDNADDKTGDSDDDGDDQNTDDTNDDDAGDDDTDDGDDLIAGKYKTVQDMAVDVGKLEQENIQLKTQMQNQNPQNPNQADSRTQAYQQVQQQLQDTLKALGEDLSPEASQKIAQLVELSNQLAVAPIAEQYYQDRNAREYEQIKKTYDNHAELEPQVNRIIAEGRAANLTDAFKLANYENLEAIAKGDKPQETQDDVDADKKKMHTKTNSPKSKSKPIKDPGAALFAKLKAGKKPAGLEKEASVLGF